MLNVYLLAEDEQLYIQYNTDWSIVNEFIIMFIYFYLFIYLFYLEICNIFNKIFKSEYFLQNAHLVLIRQLLVWRKILVQIVLKIQIIPSMGVLPSTIVNAIKDTKGSQVERAVLVSLISG